jgi:hypothetical protein
VIRVVEGQLPHSFSRAAVAGMAILMAAILCRYQDALRSTWG